MMDRESVYSAIDGERAYQGSQWGLSGSRRGGRDPQDGVYEAAPGLLVPAHDVGTWVLYMEHYLDLAREELATKQGTEAGLHMIRKVAALSVACFEQHGCPPRLPG